MSDRITQADLSAIRGRYKPKGAKAMSKRENYTGFVYQFIGGTYGGKSFNYHELEVSGMINGYSKNWSAERANGRTVPREELDDQHRCN